MVPGIQQRSRVMRNGTKLGYQRRGDRGPRGVLVNGLGGTFEAFRHVTPVHTAQRLHRRIPGRTGLP